MKRMLSVLLAAIFIFMLCPNSAYATNHLETEYIRDYETFVIRLREGAAERRDPFVLYVIETKDTAGKIAKVDYFDLVEHTGNPYQGDAFRWEIDSPYDISKTLISEDNNTKIYECTINLGWQTNAAQEAAVRNKITEVITDLGITEGMNDYTKTKLIYDYVCQNVAYGYSFVDGSHKISYTSYGALILGKAVCQGYSVLLYKMLNSVGVDNRIVAGTRNGGNHGWNLVNIDGQYYYVDATWDAGKQSDVYKYFLKGVNSSAFDGYQLFPVYQNIANAYNLASSDYKVHNCSFRDWETLVSATCTQDGIQQRVCSCGKTEQLPISCLGHNFGAWEYSYEHFTNIRKCLNNGCQEWEIQTLSKHVHICQETDKLPGQSGCRICNSVFQRGKHLIEILEKYLGVRWKIGE